MKTFILRDWLMQLWGPENPTSIGQVNRPESESGFLCYSLEEESLFLGNLGLIPRWGRSPGAGNGSPLQYSCLENPMDRRAW